MLQLGLGLALLSALTTQLGFLMRHRGAVEAPDVDVSHPWRTVVGLFSSKWWALGYLVAAVAYAFHVGALALAPLSIVQAVLSGGLVLLAVLAERLFGFELGRREWTGVVLASAGLAFLALTADGSSGRESANYSTIGLMVCCVLLVGGGAALILKGREGDRESGGPFGLYLGIAAGFLFTVSHVGIKAISHHSEGGVLAVLATPFPYLVIACGIVAFFASARSLQIGDGVAVIAVTSIASNASAMPAGVLVFADSLGPDALTIAGRVISFVVVIVAAAMIPAPTRAGERAREAGRSDEPEPAPEPAPRHEPATV
jgi:drug/metabolite transporter (DMT)-like permease